MGAQGMGHDTAKARPRHGRACLTMRCAVLLIWPSACAGVAWLAECVAIQRFYRCLGRHCVAIGAVIQAAIRCRMSQDTALCTCNTVLDKGLVSRYKNCIVIGGEGSSAATWHASVRVRAATRQGAPMTRLGGGHDTALYVPQHGAQRTLCAVHASCACSLGSGCAPGAPNLVLTQCTALSHYFGHCS